MANPKLTFNVLTFDHPAAEYTFYFYKKDQDLTQDLTGFENLSGLPGLPLLQRVHKFLVPAEVIEHFGEQDHYYTSFDVELEDGFAITKLTSPFYIKSLDKEGEIVRPKDKNSYFGNSIIKRYYNFRVHSYFQSNGYLLKPNFIDDTEIWMPSKRAQAPAYNYFDKYTLKIQFAHISALPELIVSFEGTSRVFKKSLAELYCDVPPEYFTWVLFNDKLYRHDELPDEARRHPETAYPIWNFDIRSALGQEADAPERSNKYLKYKNHITDFYINHLNKEGFKNIIPINCKGFIPVDEIKIGGVSMNSNKLLFGKINGLNSLNGKDISPISGMRDYGPLELSPYSNIHLFFIFHQSDTHKAKHIEKFFKGEVEKFTGLLKYTRLNYFLVPKFSFMFNDKENPLPEIEEFIRNREFKTDVRYIAVYISPHSKNISDEGRKSIYYRIKELLLKNSITSQVLEAEKILNPKVQYHYSMPNIAIAMLAKLNGIPWRLDTQIKNELIIGVGAFKHASINVQYIGSAFSFQNNGTFNRFECFRNNEIIELAGSILTAVKEYAIHNKNLNRLVIHFYKNMKQDELQPIEDGLRNLGLDIPVFIVSINKTESRDLVAFDESYNQRMPMSGTYINIGFNKYLLFNNTRYNDNPLREWDSFPFPIKLGIVCTDKQQEKDPKIIRELLDQVYQFSRVYWKSLSQQNLPVTIKYPEMVAEMFPYFDGYEIPPFGKDNLWFL